MSNVAASVRARLLNVAKAQGVDFNQVLVRFALERILYRLTQSQHADRFLLKAALLFTLWYVMPHRATRDADLLGFGASDLESVAQVFREIAGLKVDDGIVFDPPSVTVEEIRKEAGYGGVRVVIAGELARARCKTQIDVGFGDAVTPGPVDSVYPGRLARTPASGLSDLYRRRGKAPSHRAAGHDEQPCEGLFRPVGTAGTRNPRRCPAGPSDQGDFRASRQALWQAFVKKNELAPEP
jgi:hypothetical protein